MSDDYAGPGVPSFGVPPEELLCGKARRKERHRHHEFKVQVTDDSPDQRWFLCPGFEEADEREWCVCGYRRSGHSRLGACPTLPWSLFQRSRGFNA